MKISHEAHHRDKEDMSTQLQKEKDNNAALIKDLNRLRKMCQDLETMGKQMAREEKTPVSKVSFL
jgi:hypothetical protein